MSSLPPVLLLMGPTASGKTDLAAALAERRVVDLVSVDSVLVYRGLDIGSGKPSPSFLARYPHALIDIREPGDPYSVADFCADASRLIADSHRQGRLPVLVGGTSMYFHALCHGLGEMPAANPSLRERLTAEAEALGWSTLHEQLARIDPVAAAQIPPANRQRIQRALEVWHLTGKPISSFWAADRGFRPDLTFRPVAVAIEDGGPEIRSRRITQRFESMLQAGLIEEVRALRERGNLDASLPALRAVGYRQVWAHLEGELTRDQMVDAALAATRQLARRQLVWLRRWPGLYWLPRLPSEPVPMDALLRVLGEVV